MTTPTISKFNTKYAIPLSIGASATTTLFSLIYQQWLLATSWFITTIVWATHYSYLKGGRE